MANNFTQFSFEIEATQEQAEWILALHAICTGKPGEENRPPDEPRFSAVQTLIDHCYAGDISTSAEIESHTTGKLWFHADDCGDVEYTADLLAGFLESFNLDTILSFTWSNTCSKMRLDEFDGGAAVVTKDSVEFLSPSRWIDERIAAINAARETAATEESV